MLINILCWSPIKLRCYACRYTCTRIVNTMKGYIEKNNLQGTNTRKFISGTNPIYMQANNLQLELKRYNK